MRITLTGATGFIGKAIVEKILDDKRFDLCLAVRRSFHGLHGSLPVIQVGEISASTSWTQAVAGSSVVIHTAARVHVMHDASKNPLEDFRRTNVDGTLNLARQAADAGVKRFIFISSIGVNGASTGVQAFTEDSVPAPHSPYAISKLEAEEGLRDLARNSGMEIVIVRPPLVYAGHAPGNFHRLLKLVARGVYLPFAAIHNQRSLVALDNLISFIELCIEHPNAANELFLISDGLDVSTPEIIRNLALGMEVKPKLIAVPDFLMRCGASLIGKEAAYLQLCGSLAINCLKAKTLLGWQPEIMPAAALQQAGRDYVASLTVSR